MLDWERKLRDTQHIWKNKKWKYLRKKQKFQHDILKKEKKYTS